MKILALDTTGATASAAILDENCMYGEFTINAHTAEKKQTHSETLMPIVSSLFDLTRFKTQDMDYIAYTAGPGSFTGLRIGSSVALSLAHAAGLPTIPIPTLDALAYGTPENFNGQILTLLDAKRQQVYAALYSVCNKKIEKISDNLAISLQEAIDLVSATDVMFAGDGAFAYREILSERYPRGIFANKFVSAYAIAKNALVKLQAGEVFEKTDYQAPELIYVRQPQALRECTKS